MEHDNWALVPEDTSPRDTVIHVRLSNSVRDSLDSYAESCGRSRSTAASSLIQAGLAHWLLSLGQSTENPSVLSLLGARPPQSQRRRNPALSRQQRRTTQR